MKFLPPEGPPEVAFAGRSNVGKSSLINAHRGPRRAWRAPPTRRAARRSSTFSFRADIPARGTTCRRWRMVDMPGYGYAKAPKAQVDNWTKLVFDYLRGR
jgi:GTP-binding protein